MHASRRSFAKATLAGAVGALTPRRPLAEEGAAARPPGPAGQADLGALSLAEASRLVQERKVSPRELTQACLGRIERLDPRLNAFITVTADSALAAAGAAEAEIQGGGWRGPLHGIPVALKDLVDTAGVRTTAASALFQDRVPAQDAAVVGRLKAAGAVLLGKLNMHEFAYGGSSVISHYGVVHNPWELGHSAGGSSGGSAVAVAAGLCYAAIGSDTGGSIRQPAGYCGIVGLKPTYGRVSTDGVIPLSWYLDHVGPMTRTVRDAALMLQVIALPEPGSATGTGRPASDYAASLPAAVSSVRLGIPRPLFYEGLDPDVQSAIDTALSVLKRLTASQRDLGSLVAEAAPDSLLPPYRTVLQAEAFAYHRESAANRPALYHEETLRRIRVGGGIEAAAYIESRRHLDEARRKAPSLFERVDLLVTPTSPVPPFAIADLLSDLSTLRGKELLTLRNTGPFNALGLPTISVPCGFTAAGLPIGLQITGPPGGEAAVLRLAHAYEDATEWHTRRPALG